MTRKNQAKLSTTNFPHLADTLYLGIISSLNFDEEVLVLFSYSICFGAKK